MPSRLLRAVPNASPLTHQLLVYVLALGGTFALALLSWYLLESPILKLRRYFR